MRRRAWFRVHSWVGVNAGLLLFVLCWSGSFAAVSNELDWLLTPELRVTARGEPLSLAQLYESAAAALPAARIDRVHAPLYARSAAQAVVDLPQQKRARVFLDPYTGEVTGTGSYFSLQRFFRSFHITLFNGQVGLWIVWLLALPLLATVAAPLVFYRRWWRRFLDLRPGWSALHKLAGLWSLWFAAIIAITAGWYLFEAVRYDLVDGEFAWAGEGASAVHPLPTLPAGTALSPAELLARAQGARPGLEVKTLDVSRGGYFYVDGQAEEWLVRDRANKLYLDPRDGSIALDQRASALPAYWRWSDTADRLHFGDFGGLATKLLWFVFGLALSGLCLTGALLHARRLARGGRRWRGALAATSASLVVLAASFHGGWNEILGYGPVVGGRPAWPEVPTGVAAFIAAWILTTIAALAWWARMVSSAVFANAASHSASPVDSQQQRLSTREVQCSNAENGTLP